MCKVMLAGLCLVSLVRGADVTFSDGYFRRGDGRLFIPLGGFYANLVPMIEDGALGELRPLQQVGETAWRRWFSLLQENGCNSLRMFCRLHDHYHGHPVDRPLDAGGHIHPDVMAELEAFVAVGSEYGISFLMTVLAEPRASVYTHWAPGPGAQVHYRAEGWPWNAFVTEDLGARRLLDSHAAYFTDNEAVELQKQYVAELIPRLRDNPAIFAVELYNEMGWDGQLRWEEQPLEIAWSNEMIDTIRANAPDLPVCFSLAGHGMTGIDPVRWAREIRSDFFSSHYYGSIGGESPDLDYGGCTALLHDYCAAAMPNWLGESGVLNPAVPDEIARLALRDSIWLTIVSGGAGHMTWPMQHMPVTHLREYGLAAEFLREEDWLGEELAPPELSIDIRGVAEFFGAHEDRDGKIASPEFDSLRQYEKLSLDRGIRLAMRLGPADCDGGAVDAAAFDDAAPVLTVPEGYQARCLTSASRDAGLAYFRNQKRLRVGACELREQVERQFAFSASLPEGRYRFTVLDLDSEETQVVEAQCPGQVMAPRMSDSDFAVKFRRVQD